MCLWVFLNAGVSVVNVFFEAGVYFECAFYSTLMCILREYVFLKTAVYFLDVPVFHHRCVVFCERVFVVVVEQYIITEAYFDCVCHSTCTFVLLLGILFFSTRCAVSGCACFSTLLCSL